MIIVGFFFISSDNSYLDIVKNSSKFIESLLPKMRSIFYLDPDCSVACRNLLRSMRPFIGSYESKAYFICKIWFWLRPWFKYFCIGKSFRFTALAFVSEFPIQTIILY